MSNLNDNAELKDTPGSKDYAEPVDLTNCDREPIHIMLAGRDAVERVFGISLIESKQLFDIAIHLSGRSIIIEVERHVAAIRNDHTSYIKPMIDRIGGAKTASDLCDKAARQLRALTGFDRVMVYKFNQDGTGTVISESLDGDRESFMGLRYPASDIPKQARDLYKRSLLRIIADVTDECADIIPAKNPEGVPLDLSMSTTRAVSPIHSRRPDARQTAP